MSRADYVVSCPYCRRQYRMKLDRDEVTQKRTRATCGRCGNSFELAPRITVPGAAALAPPLPTPGARRPPPAPKPEGRVVEMTADAEDEHDIGSAVAAAAEQIAVTPEPPAAVIGAVRKTSTRIAAQRSSPSIAAQSSGKIDAQKSSPEIPELAASSPELPAQKSSPAIARQSSSTVARASSHAVAKQSSAKVAAQTSSAKLAAQSVPKTDPAIPIPPPRTWLERADPGLAGLREEPTPAALALEELL